MNSLLLVIPLLVCGATSPADRPVWVDAPAGLHGGVYEMPIIVGPEPTAADCEAKLGPIVEGAVDDYRHRTYPELPDGVVNRPPLSRIVAERWEEHLQSDSGESVFLHVLLRFDDQLRGQWRQAADYLTTSTRTDRVIRGFLLAMGLVLAGHLALRYTESHRGRTSTTPPAP